MAYLSQEPGASETLTAKEASLPTARLTSALLACGLLAGPLYVVVGSIEALTRPGFDPSRDDLSLLSNGDLGGVHIALLMSSGLLTIAGALGMRASLEHGRAATWGPLLVGLYGLGLIGAGVFSADPARGFPPGTSADAHAISWHGLLHLISGGVGFLGLIAACILFASRFAGVKQTGWAVYSVSTGALFLAAFVGIATGSQQGGTVLVVVTVAFTIGVVVGWAWVSAISALLMRESRR